VAVQMACADFAVLAAARHPSIGNAQVAGLESVDNVTLLFEVLFLHS